MRNDQEECQGSPSEAHISRHDGSLEEEEDAVWLDEEDFSDAGSGLQCTLCSAIVPEFALVAHARYHAMGD